MAAINAADPAVVLFSASADGRDLASACAARLGVGVVGGHHRLEVKDGKLTAIPSVLRGGIIAEKEAVGEPFHRHRTAGSFAREEAGAEAEVVKLDVQLRPRQPHGKVLDVVCENIGVINLEEATVIVSGGRGMAALRTSPSSRSWPTSWARLWAPDRAAVDSGWMHHQHRWARPANRLAATLHSVRHLRRHPAPGRHADLDLHRGNQTRTPMPRSSRSPISAWWATSSPVVPALTEEIPPAQGRFLTKQ